MVNWQWAIIESANGMVRKTDKPLIKPMWTKMSDTTSHHGLDLLVIMKLTGNNSH